MKQDELIRVGDRLTEYVEGFATVLGRSERRNWCHIYLSGLIPREYKIQLDGNTS